MMDDAPLKVLIVEDVSPFIHLVRRLLASANMKLDAATCLGEGLQKTSEIGFDVVLLDLGLPDSSGLDTYAAFQARFPEIPVVIFTGLDDEKMAAEAVKMGAQDYLIKGSYLAQGAAGQRLLTRSILSAVERFSIHMDLIRERALMEERVIERTEKLAQMNEHLRQLTTRLVSAQEDERRRISLELHDEAGQFITALRLSLGLIQAELSPDLTALQDKVAESIDLVDATMEKLRTLAHDLHPPALRTVGLDQVLHDYCARVMRQSQIAVEYRGGYLGDLPDHFQISIYRILQEALTNVVKHAQAGSVCVEIKRDAETVSLEIQDDGRGFSLPQPEDKITNRGLGLVGIRERVEAIGGAFSIITAPGQGTCIFASLPLFEEGE